MAQIGRGDDQTIQLDFGDNAISRSNHAAVVYDPETHQVFLGHGGKSNIVRLNDKPVISNEVLKNGDLIRLGETTLRFVALCDPDFNWAGEDGEEADNVEIA
jgi:pSer/pThr/pTyr-binding forkhead associated (FHA) protein